ncbi:MAG TPA: hypothetical protein VL225_13275 [Vicinamibacterales bacterium]|nr:hypothetical protein [Vicinamibacterales bacterium]
MRTAVAAAVAFWGTAAALHYHRLGLTLAHYDARAHLVVSRRIFDSLLPGWQQVGAVWLPLPHLLNALPIQIDPLYRSGAFAVALSIASMALAAWAIASLIQRATGSAWGGIAAAALLMLNPNVLYLQSTPMTEPLLFGTTFLAVALIAKWASASPTSATPPIPRPQPPTSRAQPPTSRPQPPTSMAPGWACVAAVLTRFEAWPIVAAAIVLAFVALRRHGWSMPAASRAVRGLALWPTWAIAAFLVNSKVTVGAWFVSSGFFIPDNPALGRPWLAWTQVWHGLAGLTGPVVPWLAVLSMIAIVTSVALETRRATLLLPLALAACAALPWAAYFNGHPVRVRYDVPLIAAAAALLGAGVALLPRVLQPIATAVALGLSVWGAGPFDLGASVIVESRREAPDAEGRRAVTAYLAAHWDGQPIMMSMGSLGHYMHDLSASGFRVRDFLHEGNGELWKYATASPRPYVEWIAIQQKEDRDELFRQSNRDPRFLAGYERVAEGGGVVLYRRERHGGSPPNSQFPTSKDFGR